MKEINLKIFGKPILTVTSKQDWINSVPDALPEKRQAEVRIWIDANGCALSIGEDFSAAELCKSYPVTVYSLMRTSELMQITLSMLR